MQDLFNDASKSNGRWTKQEHLKFLEGLRIYGRNWKKIEQLVETRNGSQIRSHAQKFFLKTKRVGLDDPIEFSPPSCDFHEQPQEATVNSKTMSESGLSRENMSYFLTKIVDHSSGSNSLDFWEALVDCKGSTENLNHPTRNSSFIAFEQENKSLTVLSKSCKKISVQTV